LQQVPSQHWLPQLAQQVLQQVQHWPSPQQLAVAAEASVAAPAVIAAIKARTLSALRIFTPPLYEIWSHA